MASFEQVADGRTTSVYQDAVRLLLLIHAAAERLPDPRPTEAPSDAVAVLYSQVLLQKLDFWLRNPDYLADELISRFEREGNPEDLELARGWPRATSPRSALIICSVICSALTNHLTKLCLCYALLVS